MRKKNLFLNILILLCIGSCVLFGWRVAKTLLKYKEARDEYESLAQYTSQQQVDTGTLKCPIDVNFAELKKINEDIVGWLYIESLNISYPIVQGKDNDYYLHRTFEQKYNFAGSIFLEATNNKDFRDPNTIIYGHNMKDGSMFGMLKHLSTEEEKRKDPHFWILTPDNDYYYEMFSLKQTLAGSDVYTLFHGLDSAFARWCRQMQNESEIALNPQDFTRTSKVVTLSTCTSNSQSRYVVQSVRKGIVLHVDS